MLTTGDGKRFAKYKLRGIFRMRLLRALSGIERGRGGDCGEVETGSGRQRMTGNAFARYELRETFRMRLLHVLSGV